MFIFVIVRLFGMLVAALQNINSDMLPAQIQYVRISFESVFCVSQTFIEIFPQYFFILFFYSYTFFHSYTFLSIH